MKKKNMKKGITLIEIILAIVLIAIILGITIPKLMSNSDRAEIKSVITSDVKSIVEAAMIWKKSSAGASGNFVNLDASDLNSRLPSNMLVDSTQGIIFSSALNTGVEDTAGDKNSETGAQYKVQWKIGAATGEAGAFSIAMDISNGVDDLNWDDKTRDYAKDVFNDVIAELTNGEGTNDQVTSGKVNGGIVSGKNSATWTAPTTGSDIDCSTTATSVCYNNIKFQ